MKHFLQWTAVTVGALALLAIGLFALSRALGATDRQEHALALMSDRDTPSGTNAFAALWLMPYDIPPEQVAAIAAADVRRFNALPRDPVTGATAGEFTSAAQGRFEKHPVEDADLPAPCTGEPAACLRKVREDVDDYRRWRQANGKLIERAALDGADYYRNLFQTHINQLLSAHLIGPQARRTSQVLDFVLGNRAAAFAGACHDIATWRRLGAGAGDLITRMLAFSLVDESSRRFALMLARSPGDQVLPPICGTALAPPVSDELSLCAAMKGEFHSTRTAILSVRDELDARWLWFDGHVTDARIAENIVGACEEATQRAIFEDRPVPWTASRKQFDFSCIANFVGCILSNIQAPAYRDYFLRAQDAGAKMRLASTVYWLHTRSDDSRTLAQRLATRPAALRSRRHPIEVVDGGAALRIQLRGKNGQHWQLSLAPDI